MQRYLKNTVVRNSMWLFVLQFANTVLPMITIPYVSRILGAAGYGEFSLAYNWITYCQVFVEYGFGMSCARKVAIEDDDQNQSDLFSRVLTSRMVLFFVASLFMISICMVMKVSRAHFVNVLILLSIAFSCVFQMNWIYQGKQQMRFITIINVVSRCLSVILILLLVREEKQVALYSFLYAVTFIFSSLIGLVVAIRKYRLSYRFPGCSEIIRELRDGWHLFTSSAVTRLFGSIGITILGFFGTTEAVGAYAAVYKIPYIMSLCFSPISQALYPYMSKRIASDKQSALNKQKKVFSSILLLFAVAGLACMGLRKWIVSLFLGIEYRRYANLILILVPQIILGILNNFTGVQTLVASGFQKLYSSSVLISMVVLLVMNLMLCPVIGAYGTAIAALMSEMVLAISLLRYCYVYVWKMKGSYEK